MNRQLNQILVEEFNPDIALPDDDEYDDAEELFVLVRSGEGTIDQRTSGFTDEVDRIWVIPQWTMEYDEDNQGHEWSYINYNNKAYQLYGGVRTPYWISLQNSVDGIV